MLMRIPIILTLLLVFQLYPGSHGEGQVVSGRSERANPVELGKIQWRRGFDEALVESKNSGRPLLVLFQEVPG